MRPILPEAPQGIYHFDRYAGGALKTLGGGLFSITVGLRGAIESPASLISYRDRAQLLLDKVEAALPDPGIPGVQISVARIYVDIREVTLTVEVRSASALEQVRERLLTRLRAAGEVAFAGELKKVKIE